MKIFSLKTITTISLLNIQVNENPAGRQYGPIKNTIPRDLSQLANSHHRPALAQGVVGALNMMNVAELGRGVGAQ